MGYLYKMLSHMFQQIENLVETGIRTGIGIGEETFLLGACFYNK